MNRLNKISNYITPLALIASIWMVINFIFLDYNLGKMLLWLVLLVLNSIFFIRQIKKLD
ncbi:MAG: hypothetical protein RR533_00675 [Carnobacterium sp.]